MDGQNPAQAKKQQTMASHGVKVVQDFRHPEYLFAQLWQMLISVWGNTLGVPGPMAQRTSASAQVVMSLQDAKSRACMM